MTNSKKKKKWIDEIKKSIVIESQKANKHATYDDGISMELDTKVFETK